jgi:hypothetical protein
MRPYPNNLPSAGIVARSARRVVQTLRTPRVLNVLSWLVWLLIVATFARWNLLHYRAPGTPAWVGLTIRTAVFTAWLLVVREWLALRLAAGR